MKKIVTFMFALLCASGAFATVRVVLPKWFTEIPENEYVGISEPGGNENQAITMALLQYMFANHAQGYGFNNTDIMSKSWSKDDVEFRHDYFNLSNEWSFKDTISYDVLETKKLPTGEIICRIAVGQSQKTEISVNYQEVSNDYRETKESEDKYRKSQKLIQATIISSLGEWLIKFYNSYDSNDNKEPLFSWESLFVTNDNREQCYYRPQKYETQYVEGKTKLIDKEAPGLGISPYSICDNLLAAYKYLLTEINYPFAYNDAILHYYNGNIPIYSDKAAHEQEIPIVLQTPIKGVTLYKQMLGSAFPVIFYSKNEKYSPSDSVYVTHYIDQKVQAYVLPPFSEYAKNYIEPKINEWQKKGEFEKTAVWQERVSEPNRKIKIKEYLEEVKAQYIPEYAKRQHFEFTLGTYDPDHEVYLIKDATLGDILIPVPLNDAPFFKQEWKKCESTPHYDVMGKEVGVSSIDFAFSNGKVFSYKADTALVYSSEEIQYNFSPLDIPMMGSFPMQNQAANRFSQDINEIVVTTPFDLNAMSSALVSYKTLFGKYEMPEKDEPFPFVVFRMKLTGTPNLIRLAKQTLALDLGQMYITEQTVPQDDKILFLVPVGVRNIYLTDGTQRQLIYSGRLMSNKIYDGVVEVK